MSLRILFLLGLVAAASGQSALPTSFDFGAAAQSISAELSSPSFVPYSKPNQKVEEFIAPGDSYTAGTGCNGNNEIMAGDAVRGKRSYPMQMSTDADNWEFINGERTLPRFSFPAYTGDRTDELVSEQLKRGNYKENNRDLPRAQPFGKPQLAVMTIGGNDAKLSTILNDCIYRAWKPGNCQETLAKLQKDIDEGTLRDKINLALYQVAHTGRESGGSNPRENFQVYVLSYITFFNEVTTPCNEFSWSYWGWGTPKLTTDLRKQLNDLTRSVNAELKAAARDLKRIGVIFIEDIDGLYRNHRYCEDRHTTKEMVDYDTWFWSPNAHFDTPSEGPGDPNNAYATGNEVPGQLLLDFIFPGQDRNARTVSEASPPWEWEGADKYPSFEALLAAIQEDGNFTSAAAPFPLLRSFHPKATAYGEHKTAIFSAMVDNREIIPSAGAANAAAGAAGASSVGNYAERCKDWDIKEDHLLVGTCVDKNGKGVRSKIAIERCLRYDNGALTPALNGEYTKNCHGCSFNPPDWSDHDTLFCICRNDKDPFGKGVHIKLDDFMLVRDDGYVKCYDYTSVPTTLKRWERGSQ